MERTGTSSSCPSDQLVIALQRGFHRLSATSTARRGSLSCLRSRSAERLVALPVRRPRLRRGHSKINSVEASARTDYFFTI
jgi:hypothetical protein